MYVLVWEKIDNAIYIDNYCFIQSYCISSNTIMNQFPWFHRRKATIENVFITGQDVTCIDGAHLDGTNADTSNAGENILLTSRAGYTIYLEQNVIQFSINQ